MDSIRSIVKRLRENRLEEAKINYSELDHDDLILLAQSGDQRAFEELVKQYNPAISKQSRKVFLDVGQGDEDDIRQIATLAFWDAVNSYDPSLHKHGFGAYANLIMSRKLNDEIRKDFADKRKLNNLAGSLDDTLTNDDGDESSVGDNVADKDLSPEEQFLGREGAKELMSFMRNKFSDKERNVVMLHIKGYKIADIMEETGMTYKQVENTLMRIKNKLTDYLKNSYRESKVLNRKKNIEFSEDEKKILESVITKINEEVALRESKISEFSRKYEDYTKSQFDDELEKIETELEEIIDDAKMTYYDERDNLIDKAEAVRMRLMAMEEFLTPKQYERSEELFSIACSVEDTDYLGDRKPEDPYYERGLSRSEFF